MTDYNKRPTKLFKLPQEGRIAGVCAGVGDYFDVKPGVVRFLTIVAAIFTSFVPVIILYAVLAMILDAKPYDLYEDEREEEFWKQTRKAPDYTAAELRRRFRDIERRTTDMEAYMTSKRFRLEREIRELQD